MNIKNDSWKEKKQLKISIFNDFFLESIYLENIIMNKLIKCALDMLKIKHNEHDLQNLNYLFRSFMIINEDYFLENHFIDICSDIEKWYNEFENVFKDYKNIESNNLEKLSKTGNSIINRLENNIEILIKYLEDENSNN